MNRKKVIILLLCSLVLVLFLQSRDKLNAANLLIISAEFLDQPPKGLNDPIWKEKLMETLRTSPWGNDDIHGYATGLHDEEVDAALDQRTAMLRKNLKPKDRDIMSLFEMRQIERNRSEEKMKVLPIR